ncbi:cyclic Di-GMP phosphodiesterase RmdB [Streptomyces calidiresistens]
MHAAPPGHPVPSGRDTAPRCPVLRGTLPPVAAVLLPLGGAVVLAEGTPLLPAGAPGLGLAVLACLIVAHLVALGPGRWWGGSGSGSAVTLAVLLLYGWTPAVLIALALVGAVVLVHRGRARDALLHASAEVIGISAGALLLAAGGVHPRGDSPWHPHRWDLADVPLIVAAACAHLLLTRALLWLCLAPTGGPSRLLRAALVRQGLISVALLGLAPLIGVVLVHAPLLLPLFAVPVIALDSTLWIARARAREQVLDPLTGLPNRQWLLDHIRRLVRESGEEGARFALILIDLDRFRSVNDTLGHSTGDRLLVRVADRVRRAVPPDAAIARPGGDEFAVLLPRVGSVTAAQRVARRLTTALGEPLNLNGIRLVVEASAGVAVFPDHAGDAEVLLRRADVAMYTAKQDRDGVQVYDPCRDANTPDRLGLLGDLRRALENRDIALHYQPKVGFDGRVRGLEALVRWDHPERGPIPPAEFIAIAESSGLMPRLTDYVMETALYRVARWREEGITVPVAVNVSPREVYAPGFAGSVAARLARHGVPAGSLQLEITENVMLEDPEQAADTLAGLTGHGVRMSLDDFGTGYSSLVHLRRLPLSELKIDRSFVSSLAVDAEDAEIVRCTVELAHSLGLVVVAEGVEDRETWERLRELGCDAVQGWLVSRAMPAEETTAWLRARAHTHALTGEPFPPSPPDGPAPDPGPPAVASPTPAPPVAGGTGRVVPPPGREPAGGGAPSRP